MKWWKRTRTSSATAGTLKTLWFREHAYSATGNSRVHYLKSHYVIQLIAFQWDTACIHSWGFELQTIKLPTPLNQVKSLTLLPPSRDMQFSLFFFCLQLSLLQNDSYHIMETCLGCSSLQSHTFLQWAWKMWSGNETNSRSKINHWLSEQAIRSLPCWCAARGKVRNVHVRRTTSNLQPLPPSREHPADQVTQIPAPCPHLGEVGHNNDTCIIATQTVM